MIFYIILIAIFLLIFTPKIYRYINKKRHPFSGKIKSFKDVNDFIANYDFLHFADKDDDGEEYDFYIIIVKQYGRTSDFLYGGTKLVDIRKGIYKTNGLRSYWFSSINKINYPIRAFIWKHKDAINAQIETENKIKESDRKEKEKILQLRKLDKNIKKDVFKFLRGAK